MTDEELRDTEYRGYQARLENQRRSLAFARADMAKHEKLVSYWLDEINTTKRKMRPYEEHAARNTQV